MTLSAESEIAQYVRRWRAAGGTDASSLRREFAHRLSSGDPEGTLPPNALVDPHALGWLHQYLAEEGRDAAFEAHTARESKHTTQTATTQVYTPRWIADFLARHAIADGEAKSVFDPACGGGQMLLAAADRLMEAGVPPVEAFGRLRGADLDPEAVWVTQASLKLAARRALGVENADLESAIDRNIAVADSLFDDLESADVVLTNPPYMGHRSMPAPLKDALQDYRPFHLDLYLAFVRRCAELANDAVGILAQQTLWYLKRFEKARRWMFDQGQLTHFAHLGHGVFGALDGEKATVVAFVWRPEGTGETKFWDLRDADDKRAAVTGPSVDLNVDHFDALPASPLAFWLPRQLLDSFDDGLRVADIADVPGSQNKTGNNGKYVRAASEVDPDDPRWVPYSKGGRFAPWWGNWDWVVDWSDEARDFYAENKTSNLLAEEYWFREGLCYSDFGGKHFNARWMPPGCVFDMAGPAIFVDGDDRDLLAALLVVLNSTPARMMLNALNPTLHFQVRDVRNTPLPRWDDATIAAFAALGNELVSYTRVAMESGEAGELLELELAADRLVAEAYGCPTLVEDINQRRLHHVLSR